MITKQLSKKNFFKQKTVSIYSPEYRSDTNNIKDIANYLILTKKNTKRTKNLLIYQIILGAFEHIFSIKTSINRIKIFLRNWKKIKTFNCIKDNEDLLKKLPIKLKPYAFIYIQKKINNINNAFNIYYKFFENLKKQKFINAQRRFRLKNLSSEILNFYATKKTKRIIGMLLGKMQELTVISEKKFLFAKRNLIHRTIKNYIKNIRINENNYNNIIYNKKLINTIFFTIKLFQLIENNISNTNNEKKIKYEKVLINIIEKIKTYLPIIYSQQYKDKLLEHITLSNKNQNEISYYKHIKNNNAVQLIISNWISKLMQIEKYNNWESKKDIYIHISIYIYKQIKKFINENKKNNIFIKKAIKKKINKSIKKQKKINTIKIIRNKINEWYKNKNLPLAYDSNHQWLTRYNIWTKGKVDIPYYIRKIDTIDYERTLKLKKEYNMERNINRKNKILEKIVFVNQIQNLINN